jgi:spore germination cell wall hydrolase CwlJ-like protein
MRLRNGWMGGVIALAVLTGAASADVVIRQGKAPIGGLGTPMVAPDMTGSAHLGLTRVELASFSADGNLAQGETRAPAIIRYSADWLAEQPAPSGGDAWECLTQAVYFEARGESIKGQFAVAEVVLNRVDSGKFAKSVCGVVKQRGGGSCQFSYVCDGHADRMREPRARDIAERIAAVMLNGAPRTLTGGATYFHTNGVRPRWSKRFERTASIGDHLFYRHP